MSGVDRMLAQLANFAALVGSELFYIDTGAEDANITASQLRAWLLASAALSGAPTAPTPAAGDNSTKIATTAYLDRLLGAINGIATLDVGGKVPTSQLPATVLGALEYQGTWNASTNSPAIPAASSSNKGWYYKVAVGGTTTIDGTNSWAANDWIVSNGATWDKVDNNELPTIKAYPPGFLKGFSLVSMSGNSVTFKAGSARDDGNSVNVDLAANITKNFGGAFVQGGGNGGAGVALPTNGSYYFFAITKNADGTVDIYGDTSISAANVPSGWTARTFLFALTTDGSANLRPMVQTGDYFAFLAPVIDVNVVSIPTTAVLRTMASVPLGLKLRIKMQADIRTVASVGNSTTYFSDPDTTDVDPSVANVYTVGITTNNSAGNETVPVECVTNTAAQIRTRSPNTAASASVGLVLLTLGWTHFRGRIP